MAKSRKPKLQTLDDPAPGAGDHLLDEPASGGGRSPIEKANERDEAEIMQQLHDEAGNGGYVRLSRRMDGSMEYASITKIDIAEYNQERVQQVYGGGYYKVKFYTALHKFCGQRQLIIDPSIPFKNPAAVVATPPAAAPGTDLVELAKVLKASTTTSGGATDVMPMMLAMMKGQSDLMQALLTQKKEDPNAALMPLLIKIAFERGEKENKSPAEEMDAYFRLFTRMKGGKSDDDDEPLSIWDKASKVLGPIAEGLVAKYLGAGEGDEPPQRRMLAAPAGPMAPAGADASTAAPAEVNGAMPAAAVPLAPVQAFPFKSKPTAMNPLVQMHINRLMAAAVAAAKQNADPVQFAKELMDEIPPKFLEQVETIAKSPDWFQTLFGKPDGQGGINYHPDALAAKEWITKMRDALLAEILEVLGPSEPAQPAQ